MSIQKHILVVEDNPIIYGELKLVLIDAGFYVDEFTPSVDDALERIEKKRPDITLLDIQLKGEKNGIHLAKLLQEQHQIPFIFVTDYADDLTFNQSSKTNPEDFIGKKDINLNEEVIVLKTKPELDEKRLLRTIIMILNRYEKVEPLLVQKDAIIAYTDYIKNTKEKGNEDVTQVVIPYKDIAYFTTNGTEIDDENGSSSSKPKFKKEKRNYTRVCTWDDKSYYIFENLAPIVSVLPDYFVRISGDYIVSLSPEVLDGRINGRRLKIRGQVFSISERYKSEVEKRFRNLYEMM